MTRQNEAESASGLFEISEILSVTLNNSTSDFGAVIHSQTHNYKAFNAFLFFSKWSGLK
jgi:hypothetical protein